MPQTGPDAGEEWLPMPRRLLAVASISAGSVLYTLDGGIPGVALPVISDKLGIATSSAMLVVSVYNLVLAMVLLPLAAVGERFGHRRIFTAGLALYLVAAAGCYLADSFALLIFFRGVQALSAAALLSVSLAMVRMVYPPSMLGRGLGFNTMASSLGAAVAPPLAGVILAHAPWHAVFIAGIPLAAIGLLTCRALPDCPPRGGSFDSLGAGLCAATFGLIIGGLQALSQQAPPAVVAASLAMGFASAVAFVRHERRSAQPVLPVDLLAQPSLSLSVSGALLAVLGSTLLLLYLPFRLHADGVSAATVGTMIVPYAVTVMIVAPTSGMLSDRVEASTLGTIGMAVATLGLLTFAWLPTHPGWLAVAWRIGLCGLGFSLFFSPNGRLVVGSVSRERAAGASSLLSTTRMFGQALGATGVAGMLALRLAPSVPFLIAAGLTAAALACSAARMVVGTGSK